MDNHNWRRLSGREATLQYEWAVQQLPRDYSYMNYQGAEFLVALDWQDKQLQADRFSKWRANYIIATLLFLWFAIAVYLDFKGDWSKDLITKALGGAADMFFLLMATWWFNKVQKAKP